MIKTNVLGIPNPRTVNDGFSWDDLESYGTGLLNQGIGTAQKEVSGYVDSNLKKILGNTGGSGSTPPIQQTSTPTQQSYEQMAKQTQATSNQSAPHPPQKMDLVGKAEKINPLIVGGVAMGLAKLFGMDWLASAGIGAGAGGLKYFLVDKKK